jgi:hypothetical protein
LIGKLFKSIFRKGEDEAPERPDTTRAASGGARAVEGAQRQWISNPWHAVGIIPCLDACGAAQSVRNVRYLSQEAPTLPLKGCTAGKCTCRYRHFQDRRGSPRRDADIIGPRMGFAGRERRLAHGRRSTDGL